ncbi:D-2-hydroxyacid dehydrogenase [Pollutibacter soli]|uniref:D-2-hydroxyacid dehydrogenase n=1 Tax=Pollutibacter soli TaxID=3034157 RepID=UPI00301410AE
MSFKILIGVDDFNEEQIDRIRRSVNVLGTIEIISQGATPVEYILALKSADICIGWPKPEWIKNSRLGFLQIGSSGWDNYQNLGLETKENFALCTGKGLYTIGVAEHAIAMMFALVRRIPVHVHDKDHKEFRRHLPYASEIEGATACIIGMGEIGKAIQKRCEGLGMKSIAVVRSINNADKNSATRYFDFERLHEAITDADHIFLTIPASPGNAGHFSDAFFSACKSSAYFYNISRGSNVDEEALLNALTKNKIAGAGLDVTNIEPLPKDSRLWELGDNVLITGHSAGLTNGFAERFCQLTINNLNNYFNKQPLINRVI